MRLKVKELTRSQTRVRVLRRALPPSDINVTVARLAVLFEDLRIEMNGIVARSLSKLDYTDRRYRRVYFVRRSIVTLLEFKSALLRLNQLPAFREIKTRFHKDESKAWDAAVEFFQQQTNPLKHARNDLGGHILEAAVRYALDEARSVTGWIEIVEKKRRSTGPKLHFAGDIVAQALARHRGSQNEKDYVESLIKLARQGLKHATMPVHLVTRYYLWNRFTG